MKKIPRKYFWLGVGSLVGMAASLPFVTVTMLRPPLELAYFLAQTLLAFIAGGALVFARDQITEAQSTRGATLLIAKANFLLEMDRRWDSADLSEGFAGIRRLKKEAAGDVEKFAESLVKLRSPDTRA